MLKTRLSKLPALRGRPTEHVRPEVSACDGGLARWRMVGTYVPPLLDGHAVSTLADAGAMQSCLTPDCCRAFQLKQGAVRSTAPRAENASSTLRTSVVSWHGTDALQVPRPAEL